MKLDDKVVIHDRRGHRVGFIERETKTFWIVNGLKFRKSNLVGVVSDPWQQLCLIEFNPEWEAYFLREKFIRHYKISLKLLSEELIFSKMTNEEMTSITELAQKYNKLVYKE